MDFRTADDAVKFQECPFGFYSPFQQITYWNDFTEMLEQSLTVLENAR